MHVWFSEICCPRLGCAGHRSPSPWCPYHGLVKSSRSRGSLAHGPRLPPALTSPPHLLAVKFMGRKLVLLFNMVPGASWGPCNADQASSSPFWPAGPSQIPLWSFQAPSFSRGAGHPSPVLCWLPTSGSGGMEQAAGPFPETHLTHSFLLKPPLLPQTPSGNL